MKVWLDDKRPMPPEFDTHVQTAQDAIALVKTGKVESFGFDHDLGDEKVVGNGYQVAKFIETEAFWGKIPRIAWSIQSDNAPGRKNIAAAMKNADKYWDKHEGSL